MFFLGILAALLLGGLGVGGYFLWKHFDEQSRTNQGQAAVDQQVKDTNNPKGADSKEEPKGDPKVDPNPKQEPKGDVPKIDIPKIDLQPLDPPEKKGTKSDRPTKEDPKVEPPKKDDPTVDPPKKEDPKIEPPKKDEPKVDPPKKEDPKQVDPQDARPYAVAKGHAAPVIAVAFTRDGKCIFTAGDDGALKLLDVTALTEKLAMPPTAGRKVLAAALAPDGETVALAYQDNGLELAYLPIGVVTATFEKANPGKPAPARFAAFSPDGKYLMATGLANGSIWDVPGQKRAGAPSPLSGIVIPAFSPDGELLAWAGTNALEILFSKLGKNERATQVRIKDQAFAPPFVGPGGLTFSPDGKLVAAAGWRDVAVRVIDVATKKPQAPLKLAPRGGKSAGPVAFAPDSKLLAVGCHDGTIQLWDVPSGQRRAVLNLGRVGDVRGVAFHPENHKLAVAIDREVQLWDLDRIALARIDVAKGGPEGGKDPNFMKVVIAAGEWKDTLLPEARVQVRLPGSPVKQAVQVPDLPPPADGYTYTVSRPEAGITFRVVSQNVDGKVAAKDPASLLTAMEHHLLGGVKNAGSLWPSKDGSLDGHTCREFFRARQEDINKPIYYMGKVVLVKEGATARLVGVVVWGAPASPINPNVPPFLESLKILKGDQVVVNPKQPDKTPNPDPVKPPVKDNTKPVVAGATEAVRVAGRIEPYLGALFDAEAKTILLALPKQIKLYSYPDFKPWTVQRVPGNLYQPVFDGDKSLLYALSPSLKAGDPTTRRGGSQVVVYDVKDLLGGKLKIGGDMKPVRTIALRAFATQLALAPDGASLYCLEAKDSKDVRVVRVDAAKGEVIGEAALLPYTDRLCLTRDGKGLYALSNLAPRGVKREGPVEGAVQVIDPAAMKVTKTVKVPTEPHDFDVSNQGVAFVSGTGGKGSEILVVDLSQEKSVLASWKGVPPGTCVKLSADGRRLYASAWKLSPARVASLGLPEPLADSELPKADWTPAPPVAVRGEVLIAPDGQFLLCESGVVFALGEAGKK